MSEAEILNGLQNLDGAGRLRVFDRLCEIQEQDVLRGGQPTEREKTMLDAALKEFETDNSTGRPWRDVIAQLRQAGRA